LRVAPTIGVAEIKEGPVRKHVLALMVVALGLVAGCGKDAAPGAGGPAGDGGPAGNGFREVQACDLFTVDDAKKIIGDNATRQEAGDKAAMSTLDVTLSLCMYADPELTHFASVTVRAPLTDAGAASNDTAFTGARPAGATDVSGYGDKAYFDPTLGQLSVLSHRTYLIFDNGDGSGNTLADAQKVADAVLPRLG
jgi:hypothetical protein